MWWLARVCVCCSGCRAWRVLCMMVLVVGCCCRCAVLCDVWCDAVNGWHHMHVGSCLVSVGAVCCVCVVVVQ